MSSRSSSRKVPASSRSRSRSRPRSSRTSPVKLDDEFATTGAQSRSHSRSRSLSADRAKRLDFGISQASLGINNISAKIANSSLLNRLQTLFRRGARQGGREAKHVTAHAARTAIRMTGEGPDRLNLAAYLWFWISSIIVVWDSAYVLLRPHSMFGGKYGTYFLPYAFYITIEKAYGDLNNAFIKSQAYLNCIEVILVCIGLAFYHRDVHAGHGQRAGLTVLLVATAATFFKTVLYVVHENITGSTAHNNWTDYIIWYAIPNDIWLVFPLLVMFHIGEKLALPAKRFS